MRTSIINARVFDGDRILARSTVVLDGTTISGIGGESAADSWIVDAAGATLLPGLFDCHVHTSPDSLALALKFGVTTELEMQGANTARNRGHITENDQVAASGPPGSASLLPVDTPVSCSPTTDHLRVATTTSPAREAAVREAAVQAAEVQTTGGRTTDEPL